LAFFKTKSKLSAQEIDALSHLWFVCKEQAHAGKEETEIFIPR